MTKRTVENILFNYNEKFMKELADRDEALMQYQKDCKEETMKMRFNIEKALAFSRDLDQLSLML